MTRSVVLYETHDGIATLTLNRPEKRNALNRALRNDLRECVQDFAADGEARVLILTGSGERAFCAGADLEEMADEQQRLPPPDLLQVFGPDNWVDKPVVAAVNGSAYAGGFLLAMLCDLCVAADSATFAISEARWGRGAPWAMPLFRLVPRRVALELLLTAQPMAARRALEAGLINCVVPLQELPRAARTLAETIRDNAPLTVRGHKAMSRLADEQGLAAATSAAHDLFRTVYLSEDALEGPRAFREKRRPIWQGR
jgi:enoyl-CoA hydratase/carnithine racemase